MGVFEKIVLPEWLFLESPRIRERMIAHLGGVYRYEIREQGDLVASGEAYNTLTTEGIHKLLEINFRSDAKISAWYLACFKNGVVPLESWTAATFNALANEYTQYSEGTRPQLVVAAAASKTVTNNASRATFTNNATNQTINGGALLSTNIKASTGGVLLSAAKFAVAESLNNIGSELNVRFDFVLDNS